MAEVESNVYGNGYGYSAFIAKQSHSVNIVDMPPVGRIRRLNRFEKYFQAALQMPLDKAVLVDEPEIKKPYNNARIALAQRGLLRELGVIVRQGKVYVIRKRA